MYSLLITNEASLAVGNFRPYWRMLRRLCSVELMTNKRINETASIRRKCVDQMIRSIEDDVAAAKARGESRELNLPHYMFLMSFNLVGNLMLSRDLLDSQCKEGHELFQAMDKVMGWAGKPNIADFLPFLKWLDPQEMKRNMSRDLGRAMEIVAGFVKERIEEHKLGKEKAKDFLDVLLEHEGDGKEWHGKIPYEKEMFFWGSETTSTTVEWFMAELLSNPEAMRKVKEELNETLTLHPALPLLIPRNALQDTNFMGCHIPRDSQVFVNAWAIGRDPDSWEDPLACKPERFLKSNIDYKGQNFELIPFGSGRRICVGITLAHRVVTLGLASLIHNFDWELVNNVIPDTLDMSERIGITMRKLVPLIIIPKNVKECLEMHLVLVMYSLN
ncbi:hypothetical protein GH714_038654 [Hevea brasiliensis]|uniref:Cytochrome P450 n=1 Tax=Hevea brasiliensis TaxID=3981 RepID=A0A6A6KNE0_HEVBR|nr:hypothetical protein GH714_038654 [Hevea brasiliensis]